MNIIVQGPMGRVLHQNRDEALVCNSCRMNFDAFRRRPLSLQCFHSYCEPCIAGMTLGKQGKKITCAQCKKTTKLDKSGNGNVLPVNYTILEMVSVNNRNIAGPVTVTGNCDNPGMVRSAFEQVTVIPVNNRDTPHQVVPCKENRVPCQMTPPSGNKQCNGGTASINVGDIHQIQNCTKPEKNFSPCEVTSSPASTTCITVTSSSSPCQPQAPPVVPPIVPQPQPGTVTSLTVKTPGSGTHPAPIVPPCPPSIPVELCCQCRVNPAVVTITSAAQMSSQKLCSSCCSLVQNKVEEEPEIRNPAPARRCNTNQACNSEGPPTTVIKIADENSFKVQPPCPAPAQPTKCELPICQFPIPSENAGHRGSIFVDGLKGVSSFQKPCNVKDVPIPKEERPTVTEVAPKEDGRSNKQPAPKLAYQACSRFDLGSLRISDHPAIMRPSADCCPRNEEVTTDPLEDIVIDSEYRPLPFNPGFIEAPEAPALEALQPDAPPFSSSTAAPPPGTFNEKQPPPGSFNEKLPLELQAPAFQYPLVPGAPPRYEEIISQPVQRGSSSTARLVHCFGKYGELATQPGAFRSPGRVNVSRNGIVVVSDPAHKTVQAFSPNGECLALIRVAGDGVGGCSCYDNNKLAVGTNAGVQIYDFNGALKKSIPIGQVINTVSAYSPGFIAVQPKILYVFRGPNDAVLRTIRDRSKPGPTRQPVPFDCITDVAVNSQKDIVVLDAGAASGLGSIFVLGEDGFLKSSVVPGREPCGVLRQPTAVTVDRDHNIIVSDSANRRILLFGANGRFQRQLLGPGQMGCSEMTTCPVGLDVTDDGRLFVACRGDRHAEVRVFAY